MKIKLSFLFGFFTFLLLLSSLKFYRPIILSDDLLKALYYFFLLISLMFSLKFIFTNSGVKRNLSFSNLIFIFLFNVLVSFFSAALFWGQPIQYSFISSFPYFAILLYFSFYQFKISVFNLEEIMIWLSVIYTICFFIAIIIYPSKIFLGYGEIDKSIDTSRGLPRIRLTLMGVAPIFFTFFYSLYKVKITTNFKYVFYALFMYLLIIMQLGRVPIIASTFLGLLYLTSDVKFKIKIIYLFLSFFVILLIYNYLPFVSDLVAYSFRDNQNLNSDNIRVSSYQFYFFDVSKNWFTVLFGNGQYSLGKSSFGDFIDTNGRDYGFIPADVGYAYIYINFGILGLFLFFSIFLKSILLKIDKRFYYVKYYLIFLFILNISGNTILGGLPFLVLSIYIIDKSKLINKNSFLYL